MRLNLSLISIRPHKHKGSIASIRARGWIASAHCARRQPKFHFFSDLSVCCVTVADCCARNNFFTVPGITTAMEVRCV
jgi:hypothetical protein